MRRSTMALQKRLFWPFFTAILVALWCALVALAWSRTLSRADGLTWDNYAYSDWLINYAGGFVRRGLIGQLLTFGYGGPVPTSALNALVFAAYVAFSLFFFFKAARLGRMLNAPLLALVIVFAPGGPMTMAVENDFYIRKDILFFLFLFAVTALGDLARRRENPLWRLGVFVAIGVGTVFLSLVHEIFVFICTIPCALILYDHAHKYGESRAWKTVQAYVVLSLAMFFLSAAYRGDSKIMYAVWESIGDANRAIISLDGKPSGGIGFLGEGLASSVALSLAVIRQRWVWFWLVPLFASVGILTYIATRTLSRDSGGIDRAIAARALALYGTVLAGIAPLFFLGQDWGRWIIATNICFFILFDRVARLPPSIERMVPRIAPLLPTFAVSVRASLVCTVLIVFELNLRMPNCCLTHLKWFPPAPSTQLLK